MRRVLICLALTACGPVAIEEYDKPFEAKWEPKVLVPLINCDLQLPEDRVLCKDLERQREKVKKPQPPVIEPPKQEPPKQKPRHDYKKPHHHHHKPHRDKHSRRKGEW